MTRNTPAEETGWRDRLDISFWREQLPFFISAGAKNISLSLSLSCPVLWALRPNLERTTLHTALTLWQRRREQGKKISQWCCHQCAVSEVIKHDCRHFSRGTLTSRDQVRPSDVIDNRCVLDSDTNVNALKVWTKCHVWWYGIQNQILYSKQ